VSRGVSGEEVGMRVGEGGYVSGEGGGWRGVGEWARENGKRSGKRRRGSLRGGKEGVKVRWKEGREEMSGGGVEE